MVISGDSWDEFKIRLGLVLRALPERTCLVIDVQPFGGPFVQFTVNLPDAGCCAELCSSEYPQELVERLQHLGFRLTSGPIIRDIAFPSRDSVYAEVCEACVLVLRDGHGIASPTMLRYECWRGPERMLPGVSYYSDELDPGEVGIELPELGIRRQDPLPPGR